MTFRAEEIHTSIESLLSSQRLAVLSTARDRQPYSSLMAFAYTTDLATLLLATGSATRKRANLEMESRVSVLIDNRTNREEDFHTASAVTVIGRAEQISPLEQEDFRQLYLERHPYLIDFITASSTVLFKIRVLHYILVNRFQNVIEYHLTDEQNIFT